MWLTSGARLFFTITSIGAIDFHSWQKDLQGNKWRPALKSYVISRGYSKQTWLVISHQYRAISLMRSSVRNITYGKRCNYWPPGSHCSSTPSCSLIPFPLERTHTRSRANSLYVQFSLSISVAPFFLPTSVLRIRIFCSQLFLCLYGIICIIFPFSFRAGWRKEIIGALVSWKWYGFWESSWLIP